VRFLIDEMFGGEVAVRLRAEGHDAAHVGELGLAGAADRDVLARATGDDRVVVTGNAVDFIPLLDERTAAGLPLSPVVIALKRSLPRGAGAMNRALAESLVRWAKAHPDPYRHVHWLGDCRPSDRGGGGVD
jgi:predicted nuclease of predicted toxin-antitoxin system